ncbi:helix-turn-helix domain-containing protein [Erythrobacter litoralis]|uniref:helix-turn-helix domain-containing protein n=1 Tax=Erythrobacter litoralis TaxID=39960 RepID=UPI002435432D|nr:helix-turn-helix domain-containing protein [Erythrobacter litoralis]
MPARHSEGTDHGELTSASLFSLDYIAPPTHVVDYVTTMYHFSCEEETFRDVFPAAIGHIVVFPYCEGFIRFADGREDAASESALLAPTGEAATIHVEGRFHAIGAALSPLGWAALTGLHAGEHGNRLYPIEHHLGEEAREHAGAIADRYRADHASVRECLDRLTDFISANLDPVDEAHVSVIRTVNSWLASSLNPELADLYEKLPYSQRQAQRLVERYFGLPPVGVRRKYRALRAAIFLSLPDIAPEFEAEVKNSFYDQPHMIREIRKFAGRTPSRLTDDPESFRAEILSPTNMREIPSLPDDLNGKG